MMIVACGDGADAENTAETLAPEAEPTDGAERSPRPAGPTPSGEETPQPEPTVEGMTGDAGASLGGAPSDVGSSGGAPATPRVENDCPTALGDADVLALDASPLPLEVQGRLCDDTPAWIAIAHANPPAAFRMELVTYSGPLIVEVFQEEDDGALERIPDVRELGVHPLDASHEEWIIARRFGRAASNALYLRVQGTAGPFGLQLSDIVLDEPLDCEPQYEGLPVRREPVELPAVFVTDLCSARDSRVVAFEVVGGRSFGVTLENPESMATMDVAIAVADEPFTLLPIDSGVNSVTMGLYGESELRFTPTADGMAALHIGLGQSLGEQTRLRIEQRR